MPRHRTPTCLINVDDLRDPGYETVWLCPDCGDEHDGFNKKCPACLKTDTEEAEEEEV